MPPALIPAKEQVVDAPTGDLIGLYKVCLQMAHVCVEENGIGLSAVQVGIPWRLFVVRTESDEHSFDYFVNCEYEPAGDGSKAPGIEGCLSLRNRDGSLRFFEVFRHRKVRLKGHRLVTDPELALEPVDLTAEGKYGIVYQHEVDHDQGILISDIGTELEIRR